MRVPFIDITRYEPDVLDKITNSVAELLKKGHFVGGPVVDLLEQALAEYTSAKYVIGCANGTDAIQVALRAAGVAKNDKVLLPDMTFWATFEAIVNVGATPCPIDVSEETLHLTLEMVKNAVALIKPKALVLVHLYGWACPDTQAIRDFCKSANIILIEDCAQAIGVKLNGKSLIEGAFIATTSFYPAKVLGASGDAGAIFTQNEKLATTIRQLINHGRISHYEHGLVGWNSRIGAYEATYLLESLKHLESRLDSRRRVIQAYHDRISQPKLKLCKPSQLITETGYLAVAMMHPEMRPEFLDYLKAHHIGYGTVYPGAMSRQPGAENFMESTITNGTADYIARSVVNLPCFAYMNDTEINYVVDVVNKFG
jgi:UDP-2-acetamido-2-deoxy-ribo-hexuluronate aminotransferase